MAPLQPSAGRFTTASELVLPAVIVLAGAGLVLLGRHVRATGDVTLVARYRRDEVADPRGLAELAGVVTVGVGIATVLLGVGHLLAFGDGLIAVWATYLLAVLAAGLWARRRGRRFVR